MLLKEFTERTNMTPTSQEFDKIHEMYCACTDLDKDNFCEDYKKHGDSAILANIYQRFELKCEVQKIEQKKMNRAAEKLLDMAAISGDSEAERIAREILGQNGVIVYKVGRSIPLNEAELDYLKENLR